MGVADDGGPPSGRTVPTTLATFEETLVSFVNITALTAPEGAGAEIEKRFAARAHSTDAAPGFEGFELLRPVYGEERYFVVTRWESQEAFQAWSDGRPKGRHEGDKARGMSVELLGFEVVQDEPAGE